MNSSLRSCHPKLFHVLIFIGKNHSFPIRYYVSKIMDVICLSRSFLSHENRSVRYLQNLKCKSTGDISRNRAFRCKIMFFPHFSRARNYSRIIMQEMLRHHFVHLASYYLFLTLLLFFCYRSHKCTIFPSRLKIVYKVRRCRSLVDVKLAFIYSTRLLGCFVRIGR